MVRDEYQGECASAVTHYEDKVTVCHAWTPAELTTKLQELAEVCSTPVTVLQRYDGITLQASEKLEEAANAINEGEEVNLDKILD
ncbi:hypothetical protein ACFL1B_02805 [Nanoarchaeota archaeon]